MPATSARISFVLSQFRRAIAETPSVKLSFGSQARQSEDPIETFFDEVADADVMATERQTLLAAVRRRFDVTVSGLSEVSDLRYAGKLPVAQYIDSDRAIERPMLVCDITIDLDKQAAKLNIWG